MAATSPQDLLDTLLDATAVDSAGVKIGAVRQVYIDDASGKATFATISTGVFSSDAIVPLYGARLLDRELHVDHTRQQVRASPRPDHTEDGLTPDQEAELMEHYGIEPDAGAATEPEAGEEAGAGVGSRQKAPGNAEPEQADPKANPMKAEPTKAGPSKAGPTKADPKNSDAKNSGPKNTAAGNGDTPPAGRSGSSRR